MINSFPKIFVIVLGLFCVVSALSQTNRCVIYGTIMDVSKNGIPGITVMLEGTQKGAVAGADGTFQIDNIKPSDYKVVISGVGHERQVKAISLEPGQKLRLDAVLEENTTDMEEVVVLGKSMAQEKMEAPIKVEAIDLGNIQERSTPVLQLINQMPGVNIRQSAGVGSDLTVNLNGLQGNAIRYFRDDIPLDYLGRAFDLGIIPVGQLSGIEVYKGVLPAKLGADALGGAINLLSTDLRQNQLDLSYSYGSFNTHQANLNAYYQLPNTKFFTRLSSYYVYSDNDYKMDIEVVDEETQTLVPATVRRFHDAVESKFAEVAIGVKDSKYADLLEIGYAYFDYEKDEQHGFTISEPFGEVVSLENFDAFHVRYAKEIGKLGFDLFGAYSERNTIFNDTTSNRYDWFGDVRAVISNNSGESGTRSFQDLDFETFVGRFNVSYKMGRAVLTANHNLSTDRRIGEDQFGSRVLIEGESVDPFTFPATYDKNITGLQLNIPYWQNRVTHIVTAKRYTVNTSSLSVTNEEDPTADFSDENYGFGTSLKYAFNNERFLRISYENATRIPESLEYFGDGMFLLGNNNLNPEQSHNINLGFYSNLDKNRDWWLDLNAFYRQVQDQIIIQPIRFIFSQYQNKDDAQIKGMEASLKTTFFDQLKVSANVTWQDARRINIQNNFEKDNEEARIPFQPYFYTNFNLNYELQNVWHRSDKLSIYTNYSFIEKYIFIQIPRSQEPGIFESVESSSIDNLEDFLIPAQHLVNLGASYKWGSSPFWLNLEVNNLLNLELYDNYRVPKQPINYQAKIRYQIK